MKLTLLLLWSLSSAPLQQTCATCQQNGVAPAGQAYPGAPYGVGSGNSQAAPYNEFTSPCADYGDGLGRCNGRGRCKSCCRDSTCNMYQHYPYAPDNHGYYYFAPYNYTMVWKHQQWITTIGGDPRTPYTRAMFIPIYEQFENTVYEPDHKPSQTLSTLPVISRKLPELESLIKKPETDPPVPAPPATSTDTSVETPAPAAALPPAGIDTPAPIADESVIAEPAPNN